MSEGMGPIFAKLYPGFEAEAQAAGEATEELLAACELLVDGAQAFSRGLRAYARACWTFNKAAWRLRRATLPSWL